MRRSRKREPSAQAVGPSTDRAMSFRRCLLCDYDFANREGTKACDLYACPYLPEVLDIACPTCNYNFFNSEGRPECSDPPSCDFALSVAPARVAALHRWQEEIGGPGVGEQ
jgi:rubredoxin